MRNPKHNFRFLFETLIDSVCTGAMVGLPAFGLVACYMKLSQINR